MSSRETSAEIASLAARILAEEPRKGDEHLSFNALLVQAKKLAGSALSQREVDPPATSAPLMMEVPLDWKMIVNAIIGSIEGSSGYWISSFVVADEPTSQTLRKEKSISLDDDDNSGIWYSRPDYWLKGGRATVTYDNPEGEGVVSQTIGRNDIEEGLRLMASKAARHFADLMTENDDAITHDVLMQYAILGDIVYG